jgi:hypothetical protein
LKLNTTGSNLIYSRLVGTAASDNVFSIVVDAFDSAYIVGSATGTAWGPGLTFAPNKFGTMGGSDAMIVKLSPAGTIATDPATGISGYGDLIGMVSSAPPFGANTPVNDDARGIAVDGNGDAFICGDTGIGGPAAIQFPIPLSFGAFVSNVNPRTDQNVFLAEITPSGSSLAFMSLLNTSSGNLAPPAGNPQPTETANGVALDTFGNIYVYGSWDGRYTPNGAPALPNLPFFPVTNYQGGNTDAFVVAFNPTGTQVVFSQTVGGAGDDAPSNTEGNGIIVDVTGDILVVGNTNQPGSFINPKNAAIVGGGGGTDVFVSRIRGFTAVVGPDRFESNDTADNATNLTAVFGTTLNLNRQFSVGNLTTAFNNGNPDYDWFSLQVGSSGTLEVDITNIRVFASGPNGTLGAGGDLNLRVFRSDGDNLTDLAPPNSPGDPGYLVNSGYQRVIVSVNAGDTIYIDVNPFNFSQATYGLRARLT